MVASSKKVVLFWLIATSVAVGLVAYLALAPESSITIEPFDLSRLQKLGDVESLRPHIRHLVEEIEAGRLLGAQATLYCDDLEQADDMGHWNYPPRGKFTNDVFYRDPATRGSEGAPYLVIHVQDKTDRIFSCYVATVLY